MCSFVYICLFVKIQNLKIRCFDFKKEKKFQEKISNKIQIHVIIFQTLCSSCWCCEDWGDDRNFFHYTSSAENIFSISKLTHSIIDVFRTLCHDTQIYLFYPSLADEKRCGVRGKKIMFFHLFQVEKQTQLFNLFLSWKIHHHFLSQEKKLLVLLRVDDEM